MAVDKLVDSGALDTAMTATANAIRAKTGDASAIPWNSSTGFVSAIQAISTGTDVSDTTAVEADVRAGKYFHKANGTKVQGSIADQAAQTITPGTTDQTIAAGKYLAGAQTIKGDANLVAANIAEGVTIFGVQGTHSGGGGGSVESKDVDFYDYDGTRVASYTATEFANLTAMPDNPSHDGLTAQGWNWSLSDAKTFVATNGKLNVGQMYVTSDGKTKLYINIPSSDQGFLALYWSQTASNGVSIDWGDGSTAQRISGTGNKGTTHTYSNSGKYVIALTVTSGTMELAYSGKRVFNNSEPYQMNFLESVEIGSSVTSLRSLTFEGCGHLTSVTIPSSVTTIGGQLFKQCVSLKYVTIPNQVAAIPYKLFEECGSLEQISLPRSVTSLSYQIFLKCFNLHKVIIPDTVTSLSWTLFPDNIIDVVLPNGITSISETMFYYCYYINNIILPSTITSIESEAFTNCKSLTTLTIPSSVTSIAAKAFDSCVGIKTYHFKSTTPPTLANTNAFNSIQSNCIIYVPSASLSAYQGANNWSTYASKMVGE